MPLQESDSIILKTYPLGEADRIVAFFSRDHGKMRGVANGARRMKNRFGASLEPLAHSRLQFFEKENRDLVRIQSAELLDSPMALFADYERAVNDMVERTGTRLAPWTLIEGNDKYFARLKVLETACRSIRMAI